MKKMIMILVLLIAVFAGFSSSVVAFDNEPGGLVLFPYYDTGIATIDLATIHNTSSESLWIRLVWIEGGPDGPCFPRDMWLQLEGNDSFTFLTDALFFADTRGFFYAYPVEEEHSVQEVPKNVLVGHSWHYHWHLSNMASRSFSCSAISFEALNPYPDGYQLMDGVEYSLAPKALLFPRFFGQSDLFKSELALIAFTGGMYFKTFADIEVCNDAGQVFTSSTVFRCWEVLGLEDIAPAANNDFLLGSAHDPDEPMGISGLVETGSLRITGDYAENVYSTIIIENASLFGILLEHIVPMSECYAVNPFKEIDPEYNNASLWGRPGRGRGQG